MKNPARRRSGRLFAALVFVAAAWIPTAMPGAAPRAAQRPAAEDKAGDDRPLDARIYQEGLQALRDGQRGEAARKLRQVFGEFPASSYAPAALLKVAEMIYPVGDWEQIGSASPQAIQEAGDLLQRLTQKYRSSREAPRALVKLGYLALEPANAKSDMDDACARFATATQVYPDSDAADDAYFGSGLCEALRARPGRAAQVFARLLDEHPDSPLAAEAAYRFGVALSRLDDPAEAMLALQQVRDRYPESRFASRALERITLMQRMRLRPELGWGAGAGAKLTAAGADLYRLDTAYGAAPARAGSGEEIRGSTDVAIDAQGLAVVASPRSPGVFRLDAGGHVRERIAHPEPEYVAVGEGLAVYISGRDQIAINARNWSGPDLKGEGGRAPRRFGPIAIDPSGRVYLLDTSENALLIYDRGRRLVGSVRPPSGKDGRFSDLAMGEDGSVYVLDSRAKMVVMLLQGREIARVPLGALGFDEPAAVAVDALGDLFVLDGKTGWVGVVDPAGKRITTIRITRDIAARLGDPSALAVDAIGRVYLSGRKTGQVVRLQ